MRRNIRITNIIQILSVLLIPFLPINTSHAEKGQQDTKRRIDPAMLCTTSGREGLSGAQHSCRPELQSIFFDLFSRQDKLRMSNLFNVMGYTHEEQLQMEKVTPMPESVEVSAETSGTGPDSFTNIKIVCHKAKFYGLSIDRAVFAFPDSLIEIASSKNATPAVIFHSVPRIEIETRVSSDNILKMFSLTSRANNLSRLRLKLAPKQSILTGWKSSGLFTIAFRIQGNPILESDTRIIFHCTGMTMNGQVIPRNTIATIFSKINPVFDSGKTWLKLKLKDISVDHGFVITQAVIMNKVPISH